MTEKTPEDGHADEPADATELDTAEAHDAPDVADDDAQTDGDADASFDEQDIDDLGAEAAPQGPSKLPLTVALFALVIALATMAGSLYTALRAPDAPVETASDDSAEQLAELNRAMEALRTETTTLRRDVAAFDATEPAPPVDVAALERRVTQGIERRLRDYESVPARMESIESALTSLRGISTGARDAWLLAEAEYYLQIANAQATLANNPVLASMALKLADERLRDIGDPGLTDIRRTLADEIQSLALIEAPDIEGATLTLSSLARVVDSLPIRNGLDIEPQEDVDPDAAETGTERAVASLKRAFSSVVSVRRTDETLQPLLAPDAVYFLRANLALQLQAARLALLRGEQALFQQSLDDAAAWLRDYYDSESQPVRSTLQTIAEVRESSFGQTVPDISTSLRLVRDYIQFSAASQTDSDSASDAQEAEQQ